jgi:hypothetical protein
MTTEHPGGAPAAPPNAQQGFVVGQGEAQNATGQTTTATADGVVLTGVQSPATPTPTTPAMQQQAGTGVIGPNTLPASTSAPAVNPGGTSPANGGRTFTADEVEEFRKQERDKLYPQLTELQNEAKQLREWREQQEAAAAAAEQQRLAAEQEAERSKMTAEELIAAQRADTDKQIAEMRTAMEQQGALFEKERELMALTQYRSGRVDAERENILPELIDLVTGSSPEEIEASIESLKQRTASIVGNVAAATQATRQQMQGTSVTAPPVGPQDIQSGQVQISTEDIRQMDMATYAANRDRLLAAARQQVAQGGIYTP